MPPPDAKRALKEAGGQTVWLIQRPGQEPRTLKTWTLTPWLAVKLVLGIAQPQRQINGHRLVDRAGIRAAPLIGGWRIAWRGRPLVELELGFVEGRSAFDAALDTTVNDTQRRRGAAALGDVVARLIDARLFNRDIKLANLIVDGDADDVGIWLIDTVGVRRSRHRVPDAGRMLERLSVQMTARGYPLSRSAWVPAMRHALRGLDSPTRRAVLQWLKAHRQPRSS